jgi:F-type H+-transporting ATPase subunit b
MAQSHPDTPRAGVALGPDPGAVPAAMAADGQAGSTQTVAVEATPAGIEPHSQTGVRLDYTMFVATWLVFLILLAILYKFVFKPILAGLDKREQDIRQAVADADRIKAEVAQLDERRRQHLAETEARVRQMIVDARASAEEAAEAIRKQTAEEARLVLEAARRQITEAEGQARTNLRRESVELAVTLASRIVAQNLDDEGHRELTNKLLREL